jgi:hypothetical protein
VAGIGLIAVNMDEREIEAPDVFWIHAHDPAISLAQG